jgi:lipoyl(octanoyl) transferase
MSTPIEIRHLGVRPYQPVYQAMGAFTDARVPGSADEIWVLEHEPVYTLGLGGKMMHVLDPGAIPVVRTDRGGQVTYHGPGQLIVYVLLDLNRRNVRVRALVSCLEQAVINCVARAGIGATRVAGAPGVYVEGRKLAALGLRVRRGRSYHGLAVNVDGDLAPFAGINPCGYPGLPVTRLADLGVNMNCQEFSARLLPELCELLDPESGIPQQTHAQQRGMSASRPEVLHG